MLITIIDDSGQWSEVSGQRSEVRGGQWSEVRGGQWSVVRGQKLEIKCKRC
ncbi:MAG: hypothetical protein WAT40_11085 [Saprospiraceae bacterium]